MLDEKILANIKLIKQVIDLNHMLIKKVTSKGEPLEINTIEEVEDYDHIVKRSKDHPFPG